MQSLQSNPKKKQTSNIYVRNWWLWARFGQVFRTSAIQLQGFLANSRMNSPRLRRLCGICVSERNIVQRVCEGHHKGLWVTSLAGNSSSSNKSPKWRCLANELSRDLWPWPARPNSQTWKTGVPSVGTRYWILLNESMMSMIQWWQWWPTYIITITITIMNHVFSDGSCNVPGIWDTVHFENCITGGARCLHRPGKMRTIKQLFTIHASWVVSKTASWVLSEFDLKYFEFWMDIQSRIPILQDRRSEWQRMPSQSANHSVPVESFFSNFNSHPRAKVGKLKIWNEWNRPRNVGLGDSDILVALDQNRIKSTGHWSGSLYSQCSVTSDKIWHVANQIRILKI